MERPFTVYFDTNFYVWLGRAGNEEAHRVIRVFNERKIRYVHSIYIVLELLSGKERSNQDQNLVDRLKLWEIEPYPIRYGYSRDTDLISWDVLLLAGHDRKEYSDELKKIFDQETNARSLSHLANKRLSPEQQLTVNNALEPFFNAIGIAEKSTDAEKTTAFLNYSIDQISQLGPLLPLETMGKMAKIDFTKSATVENLTEISEQIKAVLSDNVIASIEREDKLLNSVLALDDRPIRAATGQCSAQEIKKLGNSMRDAIHMNAFLNHVDNIDLLQVDSRQLSLILRNKAGHFISEQGVASRCFSTSNLENTVMYLIDYERGGE